MMIKVRGNGREGGEFGGMGLGGHCEDLELSRGGAWYDRFLKDHSGCCINRFPGIRKST